jgi:hypothetical protein
VRRGRCRVTRLDATPTGLVMHRLQLSGQEAAGEVPHLLQPVEDRIRPRGAERPGDVEGMPLALPRQILLPVPPAAGRRSAARPGRGSTRPATAGRPPGRGPRPSPAPGRHRQEGEIREHHAERDEHRVRPRTAGKTPDRHDDHQALQHEPDHTRILTTPAPTMSRPRQAQRDLMSLVAHVLGQAHLESGAFDHPPPKRMRTAGSAPSSPPSWSHQAKADGVDEDGVDRDVTAHPAARWRVS